MKKFKKSKIALTVIVGLLLFIMGLAVYTGGFSPIYYQTFHFTLVYAIACLIPFNSTSLNVENVSGKTRIMKTFINTGWWINLAWWGFFVMTIWDSSSLHLPGSSIYFLLVALIPVSYYVKEYHFTKKWVPYYFISLGLITLFQSYVLYPKSMQYLGNYWGNNVEVNALLIKNWVSSLCFIVGGALTWFPKFSKEKFICTTKSIPSRLTKVFWCLEAVLGVGLFFYGKFNYFGFKETFIFVYFIILLYFLQKVEKSFLQRKYQGISLVVLGCILIKAIYDISQMSLAYLRFKIQVPEMDYMSLIFAKVLFS